MSAKVATAKKATTPAAKKITAKKAPGSAIPKKVDADSAESRKTARTRRVVTHESVEKDFEALISKIEEEITKLRDNKDKVKGVKLLRSINKSLKTLKSDATRVSKIKPKSNRTMSKTAGFMKPVHISPELAAFTGWDAAKTYTRIQVTTFICEYIKARNLREENDKRNIKCDEALRNLLKWDDATAPIDPKTGKPHKLTYFLIQRYMKQHYIKTLEDNSAI